MTYFPKLIVLILFVCPVVSLKAQNHCEQQTTLSLQKLTLLLQKNEVSSIMSTLQTMESSCGENEFTLRTKLIYQIINRETTDAVYNTYIKQRFDDELISRWDNSAEADYQNIYTRNKQKFNYVPLRHATDSLMKIKAKALLNSASYSSINDEEIAILYLFAGDSEAYLDVIAERKDDEPSDVEPNVYDWHQPKHTFGIYAGLFSPLGTNNFFSKSFTAGLSIMTPLTKDFVGELQYKFRIHPGAQPFNFNYKEEIREVQSSTSHVLSLGLGYKLVDTKKITILPKVNIGLGFIWTGLSEVEYGEDDEGNETETTRFRNVNTLHSTFGLTFMRHLRNKTYIGLESNLHIIPYQWDSNLHSPIPSQYASFEFFVRF